ncbi:IMPACT family protein [Seonamhaeicola maritimus]|uniref:IMPACT family protein n=1 Tax=Seonamhaeicola maritimus TaxID=2591822 RepID=UPI0024940CF1|nr:YigZ family protein [Seonamhaeicola maritimus]
MTEQDTYKTITSKTLSVLFKDKNSKFFGFAFPVLNEDEVKKHIETLKKEHHAARHWCYAFKIGTEKVLFRANDDGEPSNSAGMPIYNQILSFEVTNILIVVIRYFGGVKLGVSGLINAYKTTAQMSLEASNIVEKTINIEYLISFDYKNMNTVMRIIKEKKLNVVNQELEMNCKITVSVRKKNAETVFNNFDRLYEIKIKKV